jgi:hypothetical protein
MATKQHQRLQLGGPQRLKKIECQTLDF